jgi:hypothetical protein
MAVRTQELKIAVHIVLRITIDVIHLKCERTTIVIDKSTRLTFVSELVDDRLSLPSTRLELQVLPDVRTIVKPSDQLLDSSCLLAGVVAVRLVRGRLRAVLAVHTRVFNSVI